jgi:hypothetical protein
MGRSGTALVQKKCGGKTRGACMGALKGRPYKSRIARRYDRGIGDECGGTRRDLCGLGLGELGVAFDEFFGAAAGEGYG